MIIAGLLLFIAISLILAYGFQARASLSFLRLLGWRSFPLPTGSAAPWNQ
jgi:hypothetical protein